ncbi:hypothetical protein DFO58_1347 [Arthrobacter sp. AG1021]|uniref:hypothetical protein n=1 Tax=Arthrobacter sp. AG1021 TaxID=2183908 RepID=UPI000F1D5489|nr:hypothetical protein [Arthrobacter sp. AG1021]RKS20804.1 hypothetical protein DFO58_1347 [Arthrobacter sp. AG1021]
MGNMTDRPHGLETLRYVRLMLLVVPLLLIVAILIYAVVNHRIEDSISSYYLGPARDLFVAMVVATGILLVVYSGTPMEDLALNLAGFYAMFVALVPTRFEASLDLLDEAGRSRAVLSVRVAIIAVLIVTAVFAYLGRRTRRWPSPDLLGTPRRRFLMILCGLLLAAFLLLVIWRVIEGTYFAGVHITAAFLLVCSMAVAIASHLGTGACATATPAVDGGPTTRRSSG